MGVQVGCGVGLFAVYVGNRDGVTVGSLEGKHDGLKEGDCSTVGWVVGLPAKYDGDRVGDSVGRSDGN